MKMLYYVEKISEEAASLFINRSINRSSEDFSDFINEEMPVYIGGRFCDQHNLQIIADCVGEELDQLSGWFKLIHVDEDGTADETLYHIMTQRKEETNHVGEVVTNVGESWPVHPEEEMDLTLREALRECGEWPPQTIKWRE